MLVQFLTHNLKAALYFLQSQSKYNHDYWPNAIIWPKAMFWPKAILEGACIQLSKDRSINRLARAVGSLQFADRTIGWDDRREPRARRCIQWMKRSAQKMLTIACFVNLPE